MKTQFNTTWRGKPATVTVEFEHDDVPIHVSNVERHQREITAHNLRLGTATTFTALVIMTKVIRVMMQRGWRLGLYMADACQWGVNLLWAENKEKFGGYFPQF